MQAGFGTVTGGPREEKTSAFVPPTPVELAAHFPQLEILELLGHGGMGAVYKARQTHLDRMVALKILPPGIGQTPSFAERFVREAKALAKLHHPNIVTLYESGQAEGLFYFLMEFVDGMNLRQLLADGTISPKDALAIVPQICDALQFAHDRGIVHRDIKPENILLSKAGQVKIADFGVAKLVAGELPESDSFGATPSESGQTEVGKVIGTPHYMAPEQISHPLEVDNRADIYALGVVFYQMLTGELPVGKFGPPSSKVQIDVRLDEVVLRALEKQPELRYQNVSALKTQIETIAANPSVPSVPLPSQTEPDRADVPAPGTFPRKGRTLAIAGAILQPGSIIGLLMARLWQIHAFGALQDRGAANLNDMGEALSISLVGTAIAAIAFIAGLVFLCISLAMSRYRAKWFFRFLTIYSWPLLLLFPFGTAAGVFFLIYCLLHREEFIGVAGTPPLPGQTRPNRADVPANRSLVPVLRWLGVAFTVFVLTVLCGAFITYKILPKAYVATAQIQVRPQGSDLSFDPTVFLSEFEIIQSPNVLLPIIKDLGLDKEWARRVFKSKENQLSDQDALAYMGKILKLDFKRGTNIIDITVASDVPKESADIANAVADRYKTLRDVEEDQRTNRGEDSLRDQIAGQQKAVDEKKAALETIRQHLGQMGLQIPSDGDAQAETDLEARQKDLLSAKEDYDARQVLLQSVINLPDDQFVSTLHGMGHDFDNASDPTHPPGKEQIAGFRRAMQVDADMARSRVDLLQKEVDERTKKVEGENPDHVLAPFRKAQRELEEQQSLLDALSPGKPGANYFPGRAA